MPLRNDAHRDEFHRDQQWHKPVRVATTGNVTISTALNVGDTIDGITLADGDRVLVKSQSSGLQNGIYIAGAVPARAYDMLVGIQAMGAFVYVRAGTANGGKLFYNTNTSLPTIDTDALTWSQFTGSGADLSGIDFLVGTASGDLSAEIVVGTTPGGELGGTWASPTVDSTHSGSAHTDFIAKSVLTTQDDIIVRDASAPARLAKGSDGQVLTVDPVTHHLAWKTPSTGSVATDTIWDAKGDLAAGTGADTASKLTVGADDTILMADAAQTTGLKWVGSQTPVTQDYSDVAAQGTADTYARGDHKHGMPADPGASGGSVAMEPFFGSGIDGDLTVSAGTTTATRDMYFNNLTVNTGCIYDPASFRIFVKGTLTLSGTGKIARTVTVGGNGGNGTAAAGGAAGTAPSSVSGGNHVAPVQGRVGLIGGFNANGNAGSNSTASTMGKSHSTSAAGGDSGTGRTGGAGASSTGDLTMTDKPLHWPSLIQIRDRTGNLINANLIQGVAPSSGSGAGSPSSGGGGSGSSGMGGAFLSICAKIITGSGNIEAIGGTGGNGGNGGGTNAGGGGGGNGGCGGWVAVIYKDKTGWSGSIDVSGGTGGTGGSGVGSGQSGGNGQTGPSGFSLLMKVG